MAHQLIITAVMHPETEPSLADNVLFLFSYRTVTVLSRDAQVFSVSKFTDC